MPDGLNFISSNPAIDEFNRANKVAQEADSADLAQQTAKFKLKTAQTEAPTRLRQLTAAADQAETNAGTAKATAPYAVPLAQAKVRQANAAATNASMQGFYKSLELLNAGDIEGAHAIAARTGEKIPDAVVQNADVRAAVTNAATTAQKLYPNRPKDQQNYIHGFITDMMQRRAQGQPANSPTAPYTVPGAPAPQTTSATTGQAGQTERIAAALQQENPKLSYAEAISLAHRAPNGDTATLRRETLALNAAKADPGYVTDPAATLERWRGTYQLESRIPQGAGTKEQPFVGTSQQHIDWFKQNAPAGSVLQVTGADGKPQLFTK